MNALDVVVLYNQPVLGTSASEAAAEAGVLESVEAVSEVLSRRGHFVRQLAASSEPRRLVEQLLALGPADVVFNLFEGLSGFSRGEAQVAGLLELLGYRLTGSPSDCLALARDKARTKSVLAGAELPTPRFVRLERESTLDEAALEELLAHGPLIVKPAEEEASIGIGPESIVRDQVALVRQIEVIRGRYGPVLAEQFVVGREFNVAVIALPEPQVLPIAEIEFKGSGPAGWQIVTYEAKWASGSAADLATPPRCPANLDEPTAEHIGRLALAAFQLTGCRQYARVDLRLTDQGEPYILEVNANPDIGPTAGLARALAAAGVGHDDFIERVAATR